jgi:hypothetical protein
MKGLDEIQSSHFLKEQRMDQSLLEPYWLRGLPSSVFCSVQNDPLLWNKAVEM